MLPLVDIRDVAVSRRAFSVTAPHLYMVSLQVKEIQHTYSIIVRDHTNFTPVVPSLCTQFFKLKQARDRRY